MIMPVMIQYGVGCVNVTLTVCGSTASTRLTLRKMPTWGDAVASVAPTPRAIIVWTNARRDSCPVLTSSISARISRSVIVRPPSRGDSGALGRNHAIAREVADGRHVAHEPDVRAPEMQRVARR